MNPAEYRELAEQVRQQRPDLYAAVYPRNYSHGDQWWSPRNLVAPAFAMEEIAAEGFQGGVNVVAQWVYAGLAQLVAAQMPTYFVQRSFFDAIEATDLPTDMKLRDLRWPFEAVLFVLPVDAITTAHHGMVPYLGIAHAAAETPLRLVPSMPPVRFKRPCVVTWCMLADTTFFAWGHPGDEDAPLTAFETDPVLDNFDMAGQRRPQTEQDRELGLLYSRLAMQFMLALVARPDLVEAEVLVQRAKPAKPGQEQKRDLWQPRFLGRRYVVRHEPQGGHHASPHAHPRRGHWRLLRMAAENRWKQDKDIWIEPTLVLR